MTQTKYAPSQDQILRLLQKACSAPCSSLDIKMFRQSHRIFDRIVFDGADEFYGATVIYGIGVMVNERRAQSELLAPEWPAVLKRLRCRSLKPIDTFQCRLLVLKYSITLR